MIVTLTGPTCGGKSTLERALQARGFGRAISHTTRAPRAGEVDGEHYHFVSDDEFVAAQARGDFIEVIDLGTRRYAMSAQSLQAAASKGHVVIVVEPHGAGQIADYCRANGLERVGFWVDCDEKVQAQRWVDRVRADASRGESAWHDAYERLSLMLTVEQKWIHDVAMLNGSEAHPNLYEAYIDSTSATPEDLAQQVEEFAGARAALQHHYKVSAVTHDLSS